MKSNLPLVILVVVPWISTGCSSSGKSQTTTALKLQSQEKKSPADSTKVARLQVDPSLLLRRGLLDLLQQDKFSELNSRLESLQQDFERDFQKERVLEEAFGAFEAYDPSMESRLHRWVQESPSSYSALLARASYFLSRAWASRGWRWAKDTSSTQFAHMELNLQKASEDVTSALKLRADLIVGFAHLISIERLVPSSASDRPLVDRALTDWPNSFLIRKALPATALTPRWGGSYKEMRALADEAQVFADANPRLKFLRGFIFADQGEMLSSEKQFDRAIQAHTQALTYGDYSYFRHERADTYYRKEDYPAALEDVTRAIALYPQSEGNYILRSKILFEMDRFAEGMNDLRMASDIWPYEGSVKEWVRGAAVHLVYKGHQLYKQNDYSTALARYNLAEQCDASHAETYYWRGVLLMRQGNLAVAQRDLERAVQLNPRHFESYQSLDWVLAEAR